jgi:hypothetical protein
VAVVKRHQIGGVEEVDHATRIALAYMKRIVERATGAATSRLASATA